MGKSCKLQYNVLKSGNNLDRFLLRYEDSKDSWNFLKLNGTVNSKINGIPKVVYLPISKLHSISAVANLLGRK